MIRKLTRQDAAAYKKLRLLALTTDPDSYFASFSEEAQRDESSFASEISAHAEPFGYYGWFDEQNVLCSYVQIAPAYFAKTKHTADLYNLYVHPEKRQQGVATELLSHVLSALSVGKQVEMVFLSVMHSNIPAQKLYEILGFQKIGEKKRSIKTVSAYLDEILMQLEL